LLKEIIIAFQAYTKAHQFLKQYKLWNWVVIPGIIYSALVITGMYFFWGYANDAITLLSNKLGIEAWLQNEHNTFLSFLFVMGGLVLRLLLMLTCIALFKYIMLILGSPVFAILSEKIESIINGRPYEFNTATFKADCLKGIKTALRNLPRQLMYLCGLLLLALIPVVGWITPVIALLLDSYYYGFSMLDYSMARQDGFTRKQSNKFVSLHKGLAVGNGIIFYLMHLVIIFAPAYAIVAATLTIHEVRKN